MPTLKERSLKTKEDASKFARSYLDKIKLSYVPKKIKNTMIEDTMGHIAVDIILEIKTYCTLDKIDIMNRIDEMLGENVLGYLEHENGNNLNDVRKKLLGKEKS